jgi:two-component sensor histidine kinase
VKPLRRVRAIFPSLERVLRRLSLRAQVAILLAVAMMPVGIFAAAQGLTNYSETKQLRREAFTLGAVEASRDEKAAILEAFGHLAALNSQLNIDGPIEQCNEVLGRFRAQEPTVPDIGFIAADGVMTCAHPEGPPREFGGQPSFKTFLESPRRVVTAQDYVELNDQQPVLIVRQPVYRSGVLRGALSMSISSRYLEWVTGNTDLAPEARFAIIASNGAGVAQSSRGDDFEWLPSVSALRAILREEERIREMQSRNGETRVYAIVPLFERDVFAIASWPGEIVPESLGWRNLLTISLPILMWALAVAVAYFAVDQLALRHILYLDRLVTAYGRSGRALRAQRMRDAPTEIAHLGTSFDEMAEEIETRENALLQTVTEKESLLREVNHRVKNNLQLISSLMSLQIRDAGTTRERLGLERLQERVQGLSLVHQKIYESENTHAVRVDSMIAEIAENLRDGSARTRAAVSLVTDLDPVTATPDMAVPLVLFATEAIVNTFKHSLSHVDKGDLEVVLKDDDKILRLSVANSLHLLAQADEVNQPKGIGHKLIEGFARQLRGQVVRTKTDDQFRVELIVPKASAASESEESPGHAAE